MVRNPMNSHQISKIDLSPEVEAGLPSKNKVIIPSFQQLSKEIGKEKVIWRYDPIFLNENYTIDYHCRYFEVLASKLARYTEKCTISFLDFYRKTERHIRSLHIQPITVEQQMEIVEKLVGIAQRYHLLLDACAESCDFGKFGVSRACCIDKERLERIGKYKLNVEKDKTREASAGARQVLISELMKLNREGLVRGKIFSESVFSKSVNGIKIRLTGAVNGG